MALPIALALLDTLLYPINSMGALIHDGVTLVVGSSAIGALVTTVLLSAMIATLLTAAGLAVWAALVGAWHAVDVPGARMGCSGSFSCCSRASVRVVKVKVAGESMWHRLPLLPADRKSFAALASAVKSKLASAAEAGTLCGLSASDIRESKVSRLVKHPDEVVGDDADALAVQSGDELVAEFKA